MKNLKFTPIYNGIWNMTPQRYAQIQKAKAYSKKVAEKRAKKEYWKDIIYGILVFIFLVALFFYIFLGLFIL